jgi:hypothetical protein
MMELGLSDEEREGLATGMSGTWPFALVQYIKCVQSLLAAASIDRCIGSSSFFFVAIFFVDILCVFICSPQG